MRFVGDSVAAVVAETRGRGRDAAEAVVVDYDPLPAVADPEAALAAGAPLQFEALGSNLAAGQGDAPGRSARRRRRRRAGAHREPAHRGDADGGQRHRGRPGAGGDGDDGHRSDRLRVDADAARLLAPAPRLVGLDPRRRSASSRRTSAARSAASPGSRPSTVVARLARRLGRPVKWVETRSENLVAMPHGRGQVQYVELGFKRDGTIVGMRCRIVGDAGAYGGFGGASPCGRPA